ncbi:MAG: YoaK family protein [Casimicrobiaceae bacterium]
MATDNSARGQHDHDLASAALMAAACGIADAVGFTHAGVFAANMTGNTVLAGISLAHQDWPVALDRIVTLVTFFGGAMAGRVLQRIWQDEPWLPLFVEAVLIAASAFVDPGQTPFIWLLAAAMGIQATALSRVHGMAISTVVVTSTMARLAETTVDMIAGDPPPEGRGKRRPTTLASTWIAYAGGAVAAVLLMNATSLPLLVPAGVVLLVCVLVKTRSASPADV